MTTCLFNYNVEEMKEEVRVIRKRINQANERHKPLDENPSFITIERKDRVAVITTEVWNKLSKKKQNLLLKEN